MTKVSKSQGVEATDLSESWLKLANMQLCYKWALLRASSDGFIMKVRTLRGNVSGIGHFFAGIVSSDVDLTCSDVCYERHGHFIFSNNLSLYGEGASSPQTIQGLPSKTWQPSDTLHIRYTRRPQRELSVSMDGNAYISVPVEIKHADFVPCVWLQFTDVVVQVTDIGTSKHCADQLRKTTCNRLWQDRHFNDCTVTCGTAEFKGHRVVLANASAVWRAALGSTFREGLDAKLSLEDGDPLAVEAVLKYVYTGEFEFDDAAAALPIAHRYDLSDLVALCVRQMVDRVTVENVADISSMLTLYAEHEEVKRVWSEFLDVISRNRSLLEATMMARNVRMRRE